MGGEPRNHPPLKQGVMKITNKEAIILQNFINEYLMGLKLPMASSLDIARLANEVDRQIAAVARVRDKLFKEYKIKTKVGEEEGTIIIANVDGSDEAITEFTAKMDELAAAETEDIVSKIHLPTDLIITVAQMKIIAPFVEAERQE